MYGDVLGLLECNTRPAIRAMMLFVNGLLNAVAKHAIPIRTVKDSDDLAELLEHEASGSRTPNKIM
jgi:hypothetical protein